MSKNKYIKENLDEYLKYKEERKDNIKLNWDEWSKLLDEYCNKEKKVPSNLTQYKNHNLGRWLSTQKRYILSKDDELYKKLSKNKYIKEILDEYLDPRKKWDKRYKLLDEYIDKKKKVQSNKIQYKDHNIGKWFQHQKSSLLSKDDELYKKLSENKYIKKNLDKYLEYKEKTKNKIKLKWDEWYILVDEYIDKEKMIPSQKTQYNNHKIGQWYQDQKKRISSKDNELYKKLSENEHIKENLNNYLAKKEIKWISKKI